MDVNNLHIWHREGYLDAYIEGNYQHIATGVCLEKADGVDDNPIVGDGNDLFPGADDITEFGPGTGGEITFLFENYPNGYAIDNYLVGSSKDVVGTSDVVIDNELDDYRELQTGFCLKNIVADDENDNVIRCDVYTNYWGGDVVEDLDLSGDNCYLGQNCVIKDGYTIEFTPPDVHENAEIFIDSDIHIEDGGTLTLIAPLSDQNANNLYVSSTGDSVFTIFIHEGGVLNWDPSPGEQGTFHHVLNNVCCVYLMDGGEVNIGENHHIDFIADGDDGPALYAEGAVLDVSNCSFSGYDVAIEVDDCTGSISDTDVDDCTIGVKTNDVGSSFTLDNVCVTDFESYGFKLISSSPTLNYCSASNSTPSGTIIPVGLYCYNGSPKIKHCDFDGNYKGLYVSGSSSTVKMGNTSVCDNSDDGFFQYDAQSYLYYSTVMSDYGHNTITGNGSEGVCAGGSASVYLGSGTYSPGYNSIYSNSGYDVKNSTAYTIYAEYNWWNNSLGPTNLYGTIDYTPWLVSAPAVYTPKDNGNSFADGMDDDELEPFASADRLFDEGEFGQALQAYAAIIANDADDARLLNILRRMRSCYERLERREDWVTLLNGLTENRNVRAEMQPLIAGIIADEMVQAGDNDDAVALVSAQLRSLDREDDAAPSLLFQLGMIERYSRNDLDAAAVVFGRFLEQYREHPLRQAVENELAECISAGGDINSPGQPEDVTDPGLPTLFALQAPYPNPFNDISTVRYAVPEAGIVNIALYNVLGQQVQVLAQGQHQPGRYEVQVTGSSLNSGLYFCKMQGNGFEKTVRMVYLK